MTIDDFIVSQKNFLNANRIGPSAPLVRHAIEIATVEECESRDAFIDKVGELTRARANSHDDYLALLLSDYRCENDGAEAAAEAVAAVDFDEYDKEWEKDAAEAARDRNAADNDYWSAVA
jgi:hypothetical protein